MKVTITKPQKVSELTVNREALAKITIFTIDGVKYSFPSNCHRSKAPLIMSTAGWTASVPGTLGKFLRLVQSKLDHLQGRANWIDFLRSFKHGGIEPVIEFLHQIGFETRDGPDWRELLVTNIIIPVTPEYLTACVKSYSWYIDLCRRRITIEHFSPNGLNQELLNLATRLTQRCDPLIFAISPTTLHHNSLLTAAVAAKFTCMPRITTHNYNSQCGYKPIVDDETLKVFGRPFKGLTESSTLPISRIKKVLAFAGSIPWHLNANKQVGVLLAGGMPAAAMLTEELWAEISKTTDLDLFIYGELEADRQEMTRLLMTHFLNLGFTMKVCGSVYQFEGSPRPIQIICSPATSPLGVLVNFDHTAVQIGYRPDEMVCTPGYNFFSPHGKTLITRYNIKIERLIKAMMRGFTPVSDERGHVINPSRIFVSASWKLNIRHQETKDDVWSDLKAKSLYLEMMGWPEQKLKSELGENFRYDIERSLLNYTPKHKLDVYDECKAEAARLKATIFDEDKLILTVKYHGWNAKLRKDIQHGLYKKASVARHRALDWEPTTLEAAMTNFQGRGETLCNGFDIYTEMINSTLPVDAETKTSASAYTNNVLLRDVEICKTYGGKLSLDTKGEVTVDSGNLRNPHSGYPGPIDHAQHTSYSTQYELSPLDRNSVPNPYRQIIGTFIFGDQKSDVEVQQLYEQEVVADEAAAAKAKRRQARKEERLAKIKREKELKKIAISRKGSDNGEQQANEDDDDEPTPTVIHVAASNEVKPMRDRERMRLKIFNKIKYEDLHKPVETRVHSTIDITELPKLIKAFSNGQDRYVTQSGFATILRSSGMVRVRATVRFIPCIIFDVDDLFLPQSSMDFFPDRRYNAVVNLENFERWILEQHTCAAALECKPATYKKVLAKVLDSKLVNPDTRVPINGLLKTTTDIVNSQEFQNELNRQCCMADHPYGNLEGVLPLISCSRLYVAKH